MPDQKYKSCTVAVLFLTKASARCLFEDPYVDEPTEHWVPFSQIENVEDCDPMAKSCDLDISEWWLRKNDIEVE